jgi:gliding motility-associated-like protein
MADGEFIYNPSNTYEGEDEFLYVLCDGDGDCDTALVTIQVVAGTGEDVELVIYNGVTPNGDGKNDTWWIDGIENYPDNEAIIFNRWGDIIQEYTGYDNKDVYWDGTGRNNKLVPDGTYYYILKVRGASLNKTFSGWIYVQAGN